MFDGTTKLMDQLASPAAASVSGSSSRSPGSSASLHYFTAASTMSSPSSLDTSATSTNFAAIEDRVRAALKWDQVDDSDLDPYWGGLARAHHFSDRSLGSFLEGDSWDMDDSLDQLLALRVLEEECKEIRARHRKEELTIQPPANYKHKPIESYFTRGNCVQQMAASSHQSDGGYEGPRDYILSKQQTGLGGRSRKQLEHLIWACLFKIRSQQSCWWVGQLIVETICICNRFYLWIRMGNAMQQIALLRRCFYPRRDVIKWWSG